MFTYKFGKVGNIDVIQMIEHRLCRKCCRMFNYDEIKGRRLFVPKYQDFLFEHIQCPPIKEIEFKKK